jgi:hypothetical protein
MKNQGHPDAPLEDLINESINIHKKCVENNFLDITHMIRSIQLLEGNIDCFRRSNGYCDQLDCCWRPYCLGKKSLFK